MVNKVSGIFDTRKPEILTNFEPTRTQQHFAEKCNINSIMAKYKKTGLLPVVTGKTPQFGDFSQVHDYQTALHKINEAQEAFDSLPAEIRKRFDNEPAKFIEFVEDSQNKDEAIKLGLIAQPEPVIAKVGDPAPLPT